MQNAIATPPGLEFLAPGRAEPFMSTIGSSNSTRSPACNAEQLWNLKVDSGLSNGLEAQIRRAIAADLDAKVGQRLVSVWDKAEEEAQRFIEKSKTKNEQLLAQLAEFQQQQDVLEAENKQLQQMLKTVTGVLGQLTMAWTPLLNGAPPMDIANLCKAVAPEMPADVCSTSASDSTGSISPHLTHESPPAALPAASDRSSSSGYSESMWDYTTGNVSKLPDVPTFPYPPVAPQVSLSLVDALGIDESECHTPVVTAPTLSDMLELDPTAPVFTPYGADYTTEYLPEVFSPYPLEYAQYADVDADADTDGFIFSIQIRKAEGSGFGLATSSSRSDEGLLRIEGVLPGGAVEAWNRQSSTSGSPEKVLLPGDSIVKVEWYDCCSKQWCDIGGVGVSVEDMKAEIEKKTTLRIMVVRSEGPRSAPPQHVPAVAERCEFSTLRAEASEFVPSGIAACAEY